VGGDFRIKLILSFGVLNALLYSFFLAVIIFYSAQSPHHAAFGSCGLASAASRAALIAKIYRVTLSVIVCILGIAFLIYGSRVFSVLYTQKRTESNRVGMTKTVMVAVTFPVALMLQCALLLYGTFGKTITQRPPLCFCTCRVDSDRALGTDQSPTRRPRCSLTQAWGITLPRYAESIWKDFLWCFFDTDSGSSSTAPRTEAGRAAIEPKVTKLKRALWGRILNCKAKHVDCKEHPFGVVLCKQHLAPVSSFLDPACLVSR
jgi:hypothetical protein